jgi:hypothetical protein
LGLRPVARAAAAAPVRNVRRSIDRSSVFVGLSGLGFA